MIRINNNWEFTPSWSEDFMRGNAPGTAVRLPHTVRESPLHYASPADYEMVSGYRKVLDLPGILPANGYFFSLTALLILQKFISMKSKSRNIVPVIPHSALRSPII